MNAAVAQFLLEELPSGSHVGIVAYSTEARVLADMTLVDEPNRWARKQLVKKLTQRTEMFTATGKGLLKGLEVFHIINVFLCVSSFVSNDSPLCTYSDTR